MHLNQIIPISLTGAMLIAFSVGCNEPNTYQPPPPMPVTVAKPIVKDLTLFLEENGETESVDRAEVRARVEGFLEEIRHEPGARVKEGDVLYVIERRQYQATLDSNQATLLGAEAAASSARAGIEVAQAGFDAAEAELNVKELELARLDSLLASNAISQKDWDDAKASRDTALASLQGKKANQSASTADLEQALAQIKKAEADVNQAQINLDYTEVKAPISGRITKTDVKRGNLVENGSLLATVVTNDPIWANFFISERVLLSLQRSSPRPENFDITSCPAYLQRSGDEGFPYEGHLDYIEPEVDQDTGTLAVRAIFGNSAGKPKIVPGLFVRVRFPIGEMKGAILIPEEAVARDQAGTYVSTIDSENVVQRKNVVLGHKEGSYIVISKGLLAEDSVVVTGLQRARQGATVKPTLTVLSMTSSSQMPSAEIPPRSPNNNE